jgi:sortase A
MTIQPSSHRPRHAAPGDDEDEFATRMLPLVPQPDAADVDARESAPDADATAMIPQIPAQTPLAQTSLAQTSPAPMNEATALIPTVPAPEQPSIRPPVGSSPPTAPAGTTPDDQPAPADDKHEKGVRVVPLRPVRTEEGYRSVYSDLTRTSTGSVVRGISRGAGEILITFGLIVLLFAGYEVWGKDAIVGDHQNDYNNQLSQQWAGEPTVAPSTPKNTVAPGDGQVMAKLFIPRLKKNWVVIQGVSIADIRYAPGHYPDTAMPGEVGNFSVAGHRTRAIFWDLDQLKPGDPVVVQTADTWFVYKVTGHEVVKPTAVEVVAPVPNKPGQVPNQALLTMTTCNPKFNNYQRLVVHGLLDRTQPRSAGDPAEMAG